MGGGVPTKESFAGWDCQEEEEVKGLCEGMSRGFVRNCGDAGGKGKVVHCDSHQSACPDHQEQTKRTWIEVS